MRNLLTETIEELARHNKTISDVLWVGSSEGQTYDNCGELHRTSWDKFAEKANKTYNDSYGSQEVNPALIIVGKDWWLERAEYDGSEWWEYKSYPDIADYKEGDVTVLYYSSI